MVSSRIVPDEASENVAISTEGHVSGGKKNTGTPADGKQSRQRRHHHRRHHHRGAKDGSGPRSNNGNSTGNDADTTSDGEGGGRDDKFKLLTEFIPYVGLGDATRDNMVRALNLGVIEHIARQHYCTICT